MFTYFTVRALFNDNRYKQYIQVRNIQESNKYIINKLQTIYIYIIKHYIYNKLNILFIYYIYASYYKF